VSPFLYFPKESEASKTKVTLELKVSNNDPSKSNKGIGIPDVSVIYVFTLLVSWSSIYKTAFGIGVDGKLNNL
jgi:hypothetical protein